MDGTGGRPARPGNGDAETVALVATTRSGMGEDAVAARSRARTSASNVRTARRMTMALSATRTRSISSADSNRPRMRNTLERPTANWPSFGRPVSSTSFFAK
jgi:hypothetical protein